MVYPILLQLVLFNCLHSCKCTNGQICFEALIGSKYRIDNERQQSTSPTVTYTLQTTLTHDRLLTKIHLHSLHWYFCQLCLWKRSSVCANELESLSRTEKVKSVGCGMASMSSGAKSRPALNRTIWTAAGSLTWGPVAWHGGWWERKSTPVRFLPGSFLQASTYGPICGKSFCSIITSAWSSVQNAVL